MATDRLSAEQRAELARLEKAATPASEQSMLQDRWIEWRGSNGGKYSIAEFDREADQEFYYAFRNAAPALLAVAEEAERLRYELDAAHKRDWTASLCDRLNEIVRENMADFIDEVRDGPEASRMVKSLHGQYNHYKHRATAAESALAAANERAEAENKRLREALDCVLACGNDKCPHCEIKAHAALRPADAGEGVG